MVERENGRGSAKAVPGQPRRRRTPEAQPNGLSREAILDEAARQFLKVGYGNTRMHDIAAKFGVTHAAIYYYFPRKSDLLYELNLSGLGELMKGATDAEHETNTAADRFILQLQRHILFVANSLPQAACCFLFEDGMPPDQLRTVQKMRRGYTTMLTESFEAAQRESAFDPDIDPRVAVDVLLGAANWMYRWLKPSRTSNVDFANSVSDLLANGFVRSRKADR